MQRLHEHGTDRLVALGEAFRERCARDSRLRFRDDPLREGEDPGDTDRGIEIVFDSGGEDGRVVLRVTPRGAVLSAEVVAVHRAVKAVSEELGVRLDSGYCWADLDFGRATDLADALLTHMRRRLRDLSGALKRRPSIPAWRWTGGSLAT